MNQKYGDGLPLYRQEQHSATTSTNEPFHTGEYKKVLSENEKLKKLLGEKELEIEILKDLLKKTNPHLQIK